MNKIRNSLRESPRSSQPKQGTLNTKKYKTIKTKKTFTKINDFKFQPSSFAQHSEKQKTAKSVPESYKTQTSYKNAGIQR